MEGQESGKRVIRVSRRCREAVRLLAVCILCIAVMVGIRAVKWIQSQTIVPGADQVMGMAVVDGEELLAGKEKATYEENPGVCYEDVLLPFDESGVLYLAQSMEEDWTGRLSSALKSFHVYAMQDDYWNRKQDAIRENHTFTLWLVGEESYYEIGLVVSGMPVIAIQTSRSEEAPERPYGGGRCRPGDIVL